MSNLTWKTLYKDYTDESEILVSHEDHQNNLIGAIQRLQPLAGRLAAEFGAGTGRLTGLHAFDLSRPMLQVAQGKQRREH
jgi:hypothetical protein